MTYDYNNPANISATSAVYILVAEDPTHKDKFIYIKTRKDKFTINDSYIDVYGVLITKSESEKLKKQKNRELDGDMVNIHIPLQRWISSYNISYGSKD